MLSLSCSTSSLFNAHECPRVTLLFMFPFMKIGEVWHWTNWHKSERRAYQELSRRPRLGANVLSWRWNRNSHTNTCIYSTTLLCSFYLFLLFYVSSLSFLTNFLTFFLSSPSRLWFMDMVLPLSLRPSVHWSERSSLQVNYLPTRYNMLLLHNSQLSTLKWH